MANKTKDLIIDSFLSLVKEKDLEKISVTDIVEKCQISRQTFYYHFDDINEMIKWAFDQETDVLCANGPSSPKWIESCADYVPFLIKYNDLFKKSVNTAYFTYIFNLLAESTFRFSHGLVTKFSCSTVTSRTEFILKCASLSFIGLLCQEFQKENPDYLGLMKKIEESFNKENNAEKK